jgi:exopolysaccharide biosynthesis polyprenyl glycosylphosphotransferase
MTPSNIGAKLASALGLCLLALIGITLAVRSDPPMARLSFIAAAFISFLGIYNWRLVLSRIIRHSALSTRLRRRLVVIGGGTEAMRIQKALGEHSDMEFVGWVQAIKPNDVVELENYRLGPLHELEDILRRNEVSVAILTEPECLQREGVSFVTKTCEKEHVQFKMVPHFFEILISGIRPDTVGGIQVLGVNCLPLSGYRSRSVKRAVDIAGALVGLALSAPLIAVFGALVYWESPGPILYRQVRQGRNGRLFYILKLRSMHVNAESQGKAQWAHKNDHRRLRIGAFMRRWNIDEVPQFWNVLRGEMSLVGPRPERPELIARFKSKIPHYQARHLYRPGMTGWAQVHGWRGNTDLEERVRHDIWYLENWSLWLDFRIMLCTFFCRENAY